MTSNSGNHYQVLGVDPGASARDIKAAYRARARAAHPDKGGSSEEFAPIARACSMNRCLITAWGSTPALSRAWARPMYPIGLFFISFLLVLSPSLVLYASFGSAGAGSGCHAITGFSSDAQPIPGIIQSFENVEYAARHTD